MQMNHKFLLYWYKIFNTDIKTLKSLKVLLHIRGHHQECISDDDYQYIYTEHKRHKSYVFRVSLCIKQRYMHAEPLIQKTINRENVVSRDQMEESRCCKRSGF